MQKKEVIRPKGSVKPIGAYSYAVKAGDLVYVAGTTATDLKTGKPTGGDIKAQTQKVMENVKEILESAGSSLDKVVKATMYIAPTDNEYIDDWTDMNEVFKEYFPRDPPARATVQIAGLYPGHTVEMEAIALA